MDVPDLRGRSERGKKERTRVSLGFWRGERRKGRERKRTRERQGRGETKTNSPPHDQS